MSTILPGAGESPRKLPALIERMVSLGSTADDSHDVSQLKRVVVAAMWFGAIPNTIFTALMFLNGSLLAGLALVFMEVIIFAVLGALHWIPSAWPGIIHLLVVANFIVIVSMMILFGGHAESGLNFAWGFSVVMAAVVVFHDRRAVSWLVVYIVLLIGTQIAFGDIEGRYEMPNAELQGVVTLSIVAGFVFLVLLYFVHQRDQLQQESDNLLRNVLPDEVAERLKRSDGMIADYFDEASILFADVVGFTPMSALMSPEETVELLNEVFSEFDRIVESAGLEKIKTIGDEYMVAAGVPQPRRDHTHAIAELALAMRDFVAANEIRGHNLTFRIGINSGPVVAGIIGRHKFTYDLWGDAVNTASRMESHGSGGAIQISERTYRLVRDRFECESKGTIDVKGKGDIKVWHLLRALES